MRSRSARMARGGRQLARGGVLAGVRYAGDADLLEAAAFVAGGKRQREAKERRDIAPICYSCRSPGRCARNIAARAGADKDAPSLKGRRGKMTSKLALRALVDRLRLACRIGAGARGRHRVEIGLQSRPRWPADAVRLIQGRAAIRRIIWHVTPSCPTGPWQVKVARPRQKSCTGTL